jgi:bifunctional oligoribonuclease and PAP phosphatase NrnA
MIYELALLAGVHITREMATCLYTAVLTDTGSFCYAGTDARTFEVAADLVRHGADPAGIAQHIYFSNPVSKMRLLGTALSNLHREGPLAWLWVTWDDLLSVSAAEEDCEGLVNYAIGISGVDVAVFFRELSDGRIRLSLRSKGDLNVARVAEHFGGGGHSHASGCTLNGPLPVAADTILTYLRERVHARLNESQYAK